MSPTLEDRDRIIVNKAIYKLGEPHRGDIVMLWYPVDPDKSFVKRVIAEEGIACASSTAGSSSTTSRSTMRTCRASIADTTTGVHRRFRKGTTS